MKYNNTFPIFLFVALVMTISSCDMIGSLERDDTLFLRFENLTDLTMDDLEVNTLDVGQLLGNTTSEYVEFDYVLVDWNMIPKLTVSSTIDGSNYVNEVVRNQTNPTVSGSCGVGCNHSSNYTPSSSYADKRIESGFYTVKISANKLPNDENKQGDLKLTLSIEQD